MAKKLVCIILVAGMIFSSACVMARPPVQKKQVEQIEQKTEETTPENEQDTGASEMPEKGDIVVFGSWEQNGDASDGPEQIRWIVLSSHGTTVKLLSEYCIDTVPFNNEHDYVTWETCSLRQWLNDTFYNEAFTEKEKERLLLTHNSFWYNDYYQTDGGNETDDFVFLLGADTQDLMYKAQSDSRFCLATLSAYQNGCDIGDNTGYAAYWISGGAANYDYALCVDAMGTYYDGGTSAWGEAVDSDYIGVRPCIQIDMKDPLPENTANPYEITADDIKAYRGELENLIYDLYDETIPTEMDAPGYSHKKEAITSLVNAIGSKDMYAYIGQMPWPEFYWRYGKEYLNKIAADSSRSLYERYQRMLAFSELPSKEEMFARILDEPVHQTNAEPRMEYENYPYDRYSVHDWEGSSFEDYPGVEDIKALFPGGEVTGHSVFPDVDDDDANDRFFIYTVYQDGLYYAGTVSGQLYVP